jgi:hypothetical protein
MAGITVKGVLVTTVSLILALAIYDKWVKGNLPF